MKYGAEGLTLGILITGLAYRSFFAAPLAILLLILFLIDKKRQLLQNRKMELNEHFVDFLSSLHTALEAGYSLENGIRTAQRDMERLYGIKDMLSMELKNIIRQMDYQRPAEEAFRHLGLRSGIEDLQNFGEVLAAAKRSGGQLSKIMEDTRRNLAEKMDTLREIRSGVAAREYEQKIMSCMPAVILLYVQFIFPELLRPLYHNPAGIFIMTICLAIYAVAFLLGRYLLEKDRKLLFP